MCTVSWLHQPGGYHLLCNRDEKRTRSAALAPTVIETRRRAVTSRRSMPTCGGTWIAVNEFGVSVCLLNGRAEARTIAGGSQPRPVVARPGVGVHQPANALLWLKQLDLRRVRALRAADSGAGTTRGRRGVEK